MNRPSNPFYQIPGVADNFESLEWLEVNLLVRSNRPGRDEIYDSHLYSIRDDFYDLMSGWDEIELREGWYHNIWSGDQVSSETDQWYNLIPECFEEFKQLLKETKEQEANVQTTSYRESQLD